MKSQNDAIADFLKSGHSITPLEALNKFNCLRLGGPCGGPQETRAGHRDEDHKGP